MSCRGLQRLSSNRYLILKLIDVAVKAIAACETSVTDPRFFVWRLSAERDTDLTVIALI